MLGINFIFALGTFVPSFGTDIRKIRTHIRSLETNFGKQYPNNLIILSFHGRIQHAGTQPAQRRRQKNLLSTHKIIRTGEAIADKVSYASSFTKGDIVGLIQAITDEIAYQMGQGYSVKIENLGVFTPALGLMKGRERESGEEDDTKRNAVSICLKDIHFKVDKELLHRTSRHCQLKRSSEKFRQSSQMFSPQERLERAKEYLRQNAFMTLSDYCQLTGLLKTSASRELKEWIAQPETGIDYKGRGTHKIYILRKT